MAKYSNSIEYNISTKLDNSGLIKLQTQIKQTEAAIQQMSNKKLISDSRLEEAKTQLNGLSTSLNKSFNSSLGMLDLSKFRKELNESGVTANGLQRAFNLTGAQGQQAFTSLARQIGNFNNGIERTSSNMDKMFVTFQNTFRWGLIASFFSQFMNALHSSIDYVKELDDSLTQIMLVTDYNRDSMNAYAKAANEAAKAVGQTTVGMTNASLIFAQQGYDLTQSQELATLSAKLANASQQDTATTSDQITAYMNAYGLSSSIEDLSSALDSWALVANVSAADVAELATASQKAASTANSVGVNMDQLNAQIATIESVTRDAPEQIGNGLKTLYARFSDIKLGKTLEDGVNLGQVTGQLNKLGVQVLDQFGNIRDVGDILEDLMVIWDDLDQTTKEASAQTLAGKFQMNRFLALMDNSDMYREYLGASENAEGTLDQMNEEYLDSLEGRTARIQASLEGIFSSIFDTDVVYPFIDAMQKFLDVIQTLIDSLGGGSTIVLGLVSALTKLFSTNIARSINDMISNQQIAEIRQSNLANVQGALVETGLDQTGIGQYIQAGASRAEGMNGQQYQLYVEQLDNYIVAAQNAAKANQQLEDTYIAVGAAAGIAFGDMDLIFKDEESIINTSSLIEQLRSFADNKDMMKQLSAIDFNSAVEEAENFSHSLTKVDDALRRLKNDGDENIDWNFDRAVKNIELANDALFDLRETGALTNDEFKKAKNVIADAFDELVDTGKIENNAEALDHLNIKMTRFVEALQHIGPETLAKGPDAIAAAIREYLTAVEGMESVEIASNGLINNLDRQFSIENIVKITSDLGQLAFAIQGIQNLGSIWKNEDLSLGEKVIQTITNLSMILPSLYSGMKAVDTLVSDTAIGKTIALASARVLQEKATKEAAKAEERLKIAEAAGDTKEIARATAELAALRKFQEKTAKEATAAEAGLTAEESAQGVVALISAKATYALTVALTTLKNLAPETWLIVASLIAISVAIKSIIKNIEEEKNTLNNLLEDYDKNYNKTQVDTSNFDKLYKEYKQTGQASDELIASGKNLAEELGIVGGNALLASGSIDQFAESVRIAKEEAERLADIESENAFDALENSARTHRPFRLNDFSYVASSASEDLSFANQFGLVGQTLDLEEGLVAQDFHLDEAIVEIDQATQKLNNELNILREQRAEWANSSSEDAENEIERIDEQIRDIEERQNHLAAVAQTTEYTQGKKIIEQQADRQASRLNEDDFSDMDYDEIWDTFTDITGPYKYIAEQYQILTANLGEEAGEAYIQGLIKGSNPQAWLDYQKEVLGSASILEDDMLHYSEDEITEIMNRAGLDGISLDDYVQSFKVSGGAGIDSGEINTLSEEVDDLRVKYEEAAETAREFREAGLDEEYPETYAALVEEMSNLETELDTARDRMEQLAIASLETSNGMDELSENWKNINDSIQNGNPGEVAASYSQLQNILAQILNVDPSAITQNFMQSEEALTAIADLANGDTDAIYRLREAFADPFIVQTYLDTIGFQGDTNELLNLVKQAQDALPDLEVGASLEDKNFRNALEKMVKDGQLAVEDVQNIFNGVGYNVQVEYTPMLYPNVEAEMESSVDVDNLSKHKASTKLQHKQIGGTIVQVPHFRFVKTGGNSGGHTYRSNTGGSGGGGRGGGGKGGKGKGGKGSKAKTIEPKEKKEHEKDYYEEVNSQLDKTEKILSRIEKEEDRLIGDKARANQNKQLDLLQKEIDLNEEKLKINKQELKDTDEKLKQQDKLAEQILKQQGISMLIPEPIFDEDGVIANYEQISKTLDDAHNKLIDKYNAAAKAGNEELTKEIEKQIDKFDEYSKNLLDSAKRHDALQSEIEETTNVLEELKNAMEDIRIAAYNSALDAAEEWQEIMNQGAELQGFFRDFDPNSYLRSFSIDERPYERILEDLYLLENEYVVAGDQANQFYDDIIAQKKKELKETSDLSEQQAILDAIQYFEDEQSRITEDFLENGAVGYWSRRLEELQFWLENPEDSSNIFGDNTAELVETYKRVLDKAAEEAENFRKKLQDLRDDVIDAVEEFDDDLDRQYDKFENLVDELEQIGDTYALYYGDDSYAELANILQKEGEVLQSELDRRQQEYEKWVELYQEALKTGDKETIQTIEDLMNDARKEMRDSAEELAKVWVKQFETSVNRSTQQMTQNVWGRNDLDELSDNWELEKQYIEDYKDEVEKAYEIDKLRNKYIDLLNDAQGASLGTQNKIRQQMQEQLDSLKNQTTMSEYDVKLANAKLEVLQKQIALEDAQRNKNKMQLRRDTQGNYRYVYRADEGDVKQAQNELLDSSFDAYELTKDQTITNNDRMISSFLDFQEKARAIAEKYKDDEIAREAALNELAEQYKKIWAALGEDFGDVTNGMYDVLWWNINNLIGDSATASMDMMNLLFDENGNIKDKTGEMWRDLATFIQNDVIDKVYDSAINCITDINISGQKLANNIANSLDIIGAGVDSLDISLAEVTDTTRKLKEATDDLFAAFNGDNAQINNAMKMISDYRTELEKTQNSASNLAKQLTEANKKIANLTAENTSYALSGGNSSSSKKNNSSTGSANSNSGGTGGGSGVQTFSNKKASSNNSIASSIKTKNISSLGNKNTNSTGPAGKRLLMYYDTGGYTGEWGSDGRLALLHEKELVLNAKDTENILDAVGLMRNMVSIIQIDALGKTLKSNINNTDKNFGDTIEQRVEINATFPNVTSADEIETALLGLSDKAYQYSYRTR